MKDGTTDYGAQAFDYPNMQHPGYTNKIYYGDQRVPHPTNSTAKIVHPDTVMRAVIEGK